MFIAPTGKTVYKLCGGYSPEGTTVTLHLLYPVMLIVPVDGRTDRVSRN